jgi:uncharacterized membrane protein
MCSQACATDTATDYGCNALRHVLPAGGERVSVAKLQVALLGSARSLQRELDRLADRADTTTPEGLHFVLQGAALIGRLHPSARLRLSRACAQCIARLP